MSAPTSLRKRSGATTSVDDQDRASRPLARTSPDLIISRKPPKPSAIFDTYWRFATERQAVFHARLAGSLQPWTRDPILREHRFTNAYRAADRVSQYLIQKIIYGTEQDWPSTMLRVLLFKIFNRISTWELIESQVGTISTRNFSSARIAQVLDQVIEKGAAIYSGAYIMPSGPAVLRQARKHRMHLALLDEINRSHLELALSRAPSLKNAYEQILAVPSFGPFLAYQYVIDLNYSPYLNFSEMDFDMPGPGARDGIRKCFDDLGDFDEAGAGLDRWPIDEPGIRGTRPSVPLAVGAPPPIDRLPNLFCEVDKYARVAHPQAKGLSGAIHASNSGFHLSVIF